jgi:hypothetical protein
VDRLLQVLDKQKNRDLTLIRVFFKDESGKKMKLEDYLKKARDCYAFEQNDEEVVVRPKGEVGDPKTLTVNFKPKQLTVFFKTHSASTFDFDIDLFAEIDPRKSHYELQGQSLVITLKKLASKNNWEFLEEAVKEEEKGSKKAHFTNSERNWSQICKCKMKRRRRIRGGFGA